MLKKSLLFSRLLSARSISSSHIPNYHHSYFEHLPPHWPKQPLVRLNNGQLMPKIGLGTAVTTEELCKPAIKDAVLNVGYRHIDTATLYGNEAWIGEALEEALNSQEAKKKSIKREDIFITTKLTEAEKSHPEKALKASLSRLRLDYVDLYLIHWPHTMYIPETDSWERIPLSQIWTELQGFVERGLVRGIGISNFNTQITADLLTYCKIKPAVQQSELHPHFANIEYVEWLKRVDIQPVAAAPIAAPGTSGSIPRMNQEVPLLQEPLVKSLAKKYCKTEAQIVLSWGLKRGHVVIPKSTVRSEYASNFSSFDFGMSDDDMMRLSSLNTYTRCFDYCLHPEHGNIPVFH